MNAIKRLIPLLSIPLIIGACATDHHAQALARESLVQVTEYRAALEDASSKTHAYYTHSLNSLERDLRAAHEIADLAETRTSTWALVDQTIREGYSDAALVAHFHAAFERVEADRAELRARLDRLTESMQAQTEKMETNKRELELIEAKLERLQTPRDSREIIRDLGPLVDVIRAAVEQDSAELESTP